MPRMGSPHVGHFFDANPLEHPQNTINVPRGVVDLDVGPIAMEQRMANPTLWVLDDHAGDFGPLTDLRAVFEIRSGARTTLERIEATLRRPTAGLIVPGALQPLVQSRASIPVCKFDDAIPSGDDALIVNGRWLGVTSPASILELNAGQALVQPDGQLVAARLPWPAVQSLLAGGTAPGVSRVMADQPMLVERPWDFLSNLPHTLAADLAATEIPIAPAPPGVHAIGSHSIHIASSARVYPSVVMVASEGPIVIDTDAVVHSFACIEGPCYIGPGATVLPHSLLHPHTVIGPRSKVAGEVAHSIFDAFCNKAHFGFVGHSLLGQWVNLGAGTTTSNLKNTYGQVRAQLHPQSEAQDTGLLMFGSIFGDYVRTAIHSRIVTGAVLHTGVMLALSGFSPKCAGRFGFYTDDDQGQPYEPEKFLQTAARMMARRGKSIHPALDQRLRELMHQKAPASAMPPKYVAAQS